MKARCPECGRLIHIWPRVRHATYPAHWTERGSGVRCEGTGWLVEAEDVAACR